MVRNRAFWRRKKTNYTLGINESEIFRRSASVTLIKLVQQKYNEGSMKELFVMKEFRSYIGYPVVFANYNDVHLAASILKIFFRELTEPLLTFRLYPQLLGHSSGKYSIVVNLSNVFFLFSIETS
jgi:hypothetical protein